MLTFVTDVRGSEPDFLAPVAHEALEIRGLNGTPIANIPSPEIGWTHDRLVAVAHQLQALVQQGADAYLGTVWVGGTEV